jgi:hypothetical protein
LDGENAGALALHPGHPPLDWPTHRPDAATSPTGRARSSLRSLAAPPGVSHSPAPAARRTAPTQSDPGRTGSAARQEKARVHLAAGRWWQAAPLLLAAFDGRDHVALGYANVDEYAADLGISKGYASKLRTIARAGIAMPGITTTAAYPAARRVQLSAPKTHAESLTIHRTAYHD